MNRRRVPPPVATGRFDARRMLAQAQLELEERYRIYEHLAARDGSRFHSHWEEA